MSIYTPKTHKNAPVTPSNGAPHAMTLRQRMWLLQDEIDKVRSNLDHLTRCLMDMHCQLEKEEGREWKA